MAWEGKKYKLENQENFEEYMKAIGEFIDYFLPSSSLNIQSHTHTCRKFQLTRKCIDSENKKTHVGTFAKSQKS